MKKIIKSIITVLSAVVLSASVIGCGYEPDYSYEAIDPGVLAEPVVSRDDPTFRDHYPTLEPYDEPVKITVAAVTTSQLKAGVPAGTTPENQAFNKIAKQYLNIDLNYTVVAASTVYDSKLNLAIGAGTTPDMFYTTDGSLFASLRDNGGLADLSGCFYNLNDELLENYLTYMPDLLPTVMKEGALYSLPMITNSYAAAQRLYIRKDWLDIVGMDAPTTIEEMIAVGQAFVDNRAEIARKTGVADARRIIPFTMQKEITWAGSYSAEGMFNAHGASIGAYFDDGNGDLIASATSPEAKNALATMREMYSKGILDVDFTSKSTEQIQANIKAGYVGMTFGEWWLPKDALDDNYKNLKDGIEVPVDWTFVDLPSYNGNEALPVVSRVSVAGYNLVSSKCAHPEAIVKLINLFYDIYYSDDSAERYVDKTDPDRKPLTLPSAGFDDQLVPIKVWDGISSIREYERVQQVFKDLFDAGFGDTENRLKDGATEEIASSEVLSTDYVVSESKGKSTILKRSVIAEINANAEYKALFDTLKNREKLLHFADGYPYYAAMRRKEKDPSVVYTAKERAGWGIYHEMIDENGSYAYVVDLTEGRKKAKYNEFYGASLTTMKDFGNYLTDRINEVYTQIITGEQELDYFDTFVEKTYNKNGGDKIIKQVNAWYDAQPKKD